MNSKTVGFAFCGSYCTFEKAIAALEKIRDIYGNVKPVMSESACRTDTRFGTAQNFIDRIETICGEKIIGTIKEAEPLGPKTPLDILVIAPCTGNTLAKLASGITDTSVTMAAKAHLRNGRPLLIALSTNDGLSGNASNIGAMLSRKNVFFVPFYQDDPVHKNFSVTADFELLPEAVDAALNGIQLQPVLRGTPV
ncbi:dipicolinate synthase subunit B [Oscillospiraceae bacterium WX1]